MSYVFGMIIGSALGIFIVSMLLSLFLYKNFVPTKRAVATVGTAYAIAVVIYGSQDGGRYLEALLFYGIGSMAVFVERLHHYRKNWTDDDSIADTFR